MSTYITASYRARQRQSHRRAVPANRTAAANETTSSTRERAAAIRERASNDPLDTYGVILGRTEFVKRGPAEYAARCPLHDDHNPSFRVNVEKILWYCPPCGRGGGVFELFAALHSLSPRTDFPRIVDELGALLGVAGAGWSAAKGGTLTRRSHRPSSRERVAQELAQEPAAPAVPPCCLVSPPNCEHWIEFDRQYLVAVLRGNLGVAIEELGAKAAGGISYDLTPRDPNLPLSSDELIVGIKFAIPFGAIVPAGMPDFIVDRLVAEAVNTHLSTKKD